MESWVGCGNETVGLNPISVLPFFLFTICNNCYWGVSLAEQNSCVRVLSSLLQITVDVVQIIDNVTRWPVDVTNAAASMYVFTLHGCTVWLEGILSPFCRIIDAFEDTVNVILLDMNFDEPLLVAEDDVALRAERVKQPWVFETSNKSALIITTPIDNYTGRSRESRTEWKNDCS